MFRLNNILGTPAIAVSNEKHIDVRKDMYAFQTRVGKGTHLDFSRSIRRGSIEKIRLGGFFRF